MYTAWKGRWWFRRRFGRTERSRRSGRLSLLLRGGADVKSAPLLEIALRRVKSLLASAQALLEALELLLPKVEGPLPALDGRFEIGGVRLARAEALFRDRQPSAALGHLGGELLQV